MFRLAMDGQVQWPVKLEQVQADGGTATAELLVTYKVLTRSEQRERDAELAALRTALDALRPADDQPLTAEQINQRAALLQQHTAADDARLRDRLRGWRGLLDASDTPVPYSEATRDALIDNGMLRDALLAGLLDCSAGAPAKNSLPGLAGWPVPAPMTQA